MTLFLRLFEPKCGALGKKKEEQWSIIEKKVIPVLSKEAVDVKEQYYRRQIQRLETDIKTLRDTDKDATDDPGGDQQSIAASTAMNTG